MSKRLKILIGLVAVFTLSLVTLICGCVGEPTVDKMLTENGAHDQCVTYYAGGGTFDGSGNKVKKDIYYLEDVYVINDFSKVDGISINRRNYAFVCWNYVQLNEDGTLPLNEKGEPIIEDSGKPVDFKKKIQKGEHWYFIASWKRDIYVEVLLGSGNPIQNSAGEEVKPNEELTTKDFSYGELTLDYKTQPFESKDSTFLEYYYDFECTKPITEKLLQPESENLQIYAKYIPGKYTIVRNSTDVENMFNGLYNKNNKYYLFNNSADKTIDMTGKTLALRAREIANPDTIDFLAEIHGNGFTVKNLNIYENTSRMQNYSILGSLGETALIKDLTFDSITVTVNVFSTSQLCEFHAIWSSVNGATIENVAINNVKVTFTGSSGLPINSTVFDNQEACDNNKDNWLFGGNDGYTDLDVLKNYEGLTVNDVTITLFYNTPIIIQTQI